MNQFTNTLNLASQKKLRHIKNIILHTGSQNFNRIRVGIDRSKYIKVVDYVLSRFTKDEQDAINQGIENASDAVIDYLDHGFNHAMNRFN